MNSTLLKRVKWEKEHKIVECVEANEYRNRHKDFVQSIFIEIPKEKEEMPKDELAKSLDDLLAHICEEE